MKTKLSIIDFIKEVELPGSRYEHNYVFYTGIADQEIVINTVFAYLRDFKEPENVVEGKFEIELIKVMSKSTDTIPKGYNALVFVGSNIDLDKIKNTIKFNQQGNIEHVCILTNNLEPQG